MPFKSEKQRKWMHANEPEMAKKWEKKKKSESFNFLKKGIKAFVSEKMNPEQYHRYMQYVFDTQFNTPEEKKMKKSIIKKINKAQKKKGLPVFKESVNEAERDYKDEYKKFQSSTKSKKYRAELNKYNRKKGTYGNGDGKDASHKGGKIVGFESESKNRGRAEKSRLKKEETTRQEIEEYVDGILDGMGEEFMVNEGMTKYNIRLTKTPGWYGIWDKKGKQKAEGDKKYITKFLKSLKTRMGNFAIKSLVDVATDKKGKDISFDVVESINELRKFHPKKLGDNYLGGFNSPKGDTEMFGDKKGNFYIWVKPKGKKERYIDLPKNIKDRSKADVFHKKIQKTMGESVEEGFGGDLKGADKKKFEKDRKDNAEQLGYTLTGKSDVNESVNEAIEPSGIMAKINKIVQDKQAAKIDGVLMDMFSASIMMRIFNAVNDKSKKDMNKGTMRQVKVILHKVMKQNKVRA